MSNKPRPIRSWKRPTLVALFATNKSTVVPTKSADIDDLEVDDDEDDNDDNDDDKSEKNDGVTITDEQAETPLIDAIKSGRLELTKALIEKNPESISNIVDEHGGSVLHAACRHGKLEIVRYLIDYRKMIGEELDIHGYNSLHLVSWKGHLPIVKYLVEQCKMDIMLRTREFFTGLHLASKEGHIDIVKYYIASCEMDSYLKVHDNMIPLHIAAQYGHKHIVEFFVDEKKVHIDTEADNECTALYYALENGHLELVKRLVKRGASTEKKFMNNFTSIHVAANHVSVLKYLIDEVKLNPKLLSSAKESPLHIACLKGNFDSINYLVESVGLNIHDKNTNDETMVHYACKGGSLEVVTYLIETKKLDGSTKSRKKITPYIYACRYFYFDIARYLIDKKIADCTEKDKNKKTILHYACEKNDFVMVKYLIEMCKIKPKMLNGKDMNGDTPLHFALKDPQIELVTYLLEEQKADFCSPNKVGVTALDLASDKEKAGNCQELVSRWIDEQANAYRNNTNDEAHQSIVESITEDADNLERFVTHLISIGDLKLVANVFADFLSYMKSPVALLNRELMGGGKDSLENTAKGNKQAAANRMAATSDIVRVFRDCLESQDFHVIFYVVQIIHALHNAADSHITETVDILDACRRFELVLSEIFASNTIDDPKVCISLLIKEEKRRQEVLSSVENEDTFMALIYQGDSLIPFCLQNGLRVLFDKPQVNSLINKIYYEYRKQVEYGEHEVGVTDPFLTYSSIYAYSLHLLPLEKPWELLHEYTEQVKHTHTMRTNPSATMFIEFLSKAVVLWLVMVVTVQEYGGTFGLNYHVNETMIHDQGMTEHSRFEIILLILSLADVIFEIGQVMDEEHGKVRFEDLQAWAINHFSDEWNFLDLICGIAFMIWILLRFVLHTKYFMAARVVLSMTAIPLTLGMMRYLSVYRPLGELSLLIKGMISAIFNFVIIYIVSVLGFGIAFYGLFPHTDSYQSAGYTALTLFGNTLANYEFTAFDTTSDLVNYLGIALLLIFVLFTAIVLMNLLIAQMSNQYDAIREKSQQEWSFMYAKLVDDYLLLQERNPLCRLPPPLNILIMIVWAWEWCLVTFLSMFMALLATTSSSSHTSLQRYAVHHHAANANSTTLSSWRTISWSGTLSNMFYAYTAGTLSRGYHAISHIVYIITQEIFPLFFLLTMNNKEERIGFVNYLSNLFWIVLYLLLVWIMFVIDLALMPLCILVWEISLHGQPQKQPQSSGSTFSFAYLEVHLREDDEGNNNNRKEGENSMMLNASSSSATTATAAGGSMTAAASVNALLSSFGITTHPKKFILFTDADIERILRPLKPHVRALTNGELCRLESNLGFETERVFLQQSITTSEMKEEQKKMQEKLMSMEEKIVNMEEKMTILIDLLSKQSQK